MEISIHALTVDRVEDFLAFFDGPAFSDNVEWSGCYCFFPYHDPTTGPWGARSATENRQARIDGVNDGTVSGLLAYHEGEVVGWCNVNRRDAYPTLRALPGDGDTIGATPCFIIDPGYRNQGIAGQLLAVACEASADNGCTSMAAAPSRSETSAKLNARGTYRMFEAAGYRTVTELPDGTTTMERTLP
ncbi:MAG: hypothetical protein CMQ05_17305 [Gammaproteobacteria bacterium]|nr:hypothetical protein [Gammaproteobacteria bacterium]|tara:strand:+ start:6143 stop:6706 length:564 start_codon:yes stop_codon:yes gene_type:complete